MSRKININKYEGNTHYSVSVTDKYGQEHHIGYYKHLYTNKLQEKAEEIWSNEVKYEPSLLDKAIAQCVQIDIERGVEPLLD